MSRLHNSFANFDMFRSCAAIEVQINEVICVCVYVFLIFCVVFWFENLQKEAQIHEKEKRERKEKKNTSNKFLNK